MAEVEHFPNEDEPILTYPLFDVEYNYAGSLDAGEGDFANYIRGVDGNRLIYWGEDYNETGDINSFRVREVIVNP